MPADEYYVFRKTPIVAYNFAGADLNWFAFVVFVAVVVFVAAAAAVAAVVGNAGIAAFVRVSVDSVLVELPSWAVHRETEMPVVAFPCRDAEACRCCCCCCRCCCCTGAEPRRCDVADWPAAQLFVQCCFPDCFLWSAVKNPSFHVKVPLFLHYWYHHPRASWRD